MIYQPKNIQPNNNSAVDINNPVDISMQVSTNSYISAYSFSLYNGENTLVYSKPLSNLNGGIIEDYFASSSQNTWIEPKIEWEYNFENAELTIHPKFYIHGEGFTDNDEKTGTITINEDISVTFTYTFGTITPPSDYDDAYMFDLGSQTVSVNLNSGDRTVLGCILPLTLDMGIWYDPGTIRKSYTFYPYKVLYNNDTFNLHLELPIGNLIENGTDYYWTMRLASDVYDMEELNGFVQSYVSSTVIELEPNLSINVGSHIWCGGEEREIISYDPATGNLTVGSPFNIFISQGRYYTISKNYLDILPRQVLKARANPSLSINIITTPPDPVHPTVFDTRKIKFKGQYSQSQHIPMVWHQWKVGIYNGSNNPIDYLYDSGKVYSANLDFEYDTFRPLKNYQIELITENEYNQIKTTYIIVSISYMPISYNEKPIPSLICEKDAIQVNWNAQASFPGGKFSSSCVLGEGLDDFPLLYNTPYNGTNSLDTGSNNIGYQNHKDISFGIATMPTNERITTQFKLDDNFFLDSEGHYKSFSPLVLFPTMTDTGLMYDTENLLGSTFLFIDDKYLGVGKTVPGFVETQALHFACWGQEIVDGYYTKVKINMSIEGLEDDIYGVFHIWHLENDCESECYFVNKLLEIQQDEQGYITATLATPIPVKGSFNYSFFPLNVRKHPFYTGVEDKFALQNTITASNDADYRWLDSEEWVDTKYWVEGGGAPARLLNNWWKVEITPTNIKIEKGGV